MFDIIKKWRKGEAEARYRSVVMTRLNERLLAALYLRRRYPQLVEAAGFTPATSIFSSKGFAEMRCFIEETQKT